VLTRVARTVFILLALVVVPVSRASAEWQVKPYVGLALAGHTTFIDLEDAAGGPNPTLGANLTLLGNVLGLEADVSVAPGFFEGGDLQLVATSSVTTFTGNVVVTMPRRLTEYTLRPYFVGGIGAMRVRIDDALGVLQVTRTLTAIDVGGGVTGFLTDRIGLNWDVRRFQSVGDNGPVGGVSFGDESLSYWRATMAIAIRY
jgi:hypothetical protein